MATWKWYTRLLFSMYYCSMLVTRLCSSWDSVGMVGFKPLRKWSSLAVSIEISLSTGVRLISVIRIKNNFWPCLLLKAVESNHNFSTGHPNVIIDSVFRFGTRRWTFVFIKENHLPHWTFCRNQKRTIYDEKWNTLRTTTASSIKPTHPVGK